MKSRIHTTEQFILKSKSNLNNVGKYSYTNTIYKNAKTKVIITCLRCNRDFDQFPSNHMAGHDACPFCGPAGRRNNWVFKEKNKHRLNFSYDKVDYIDAHTKIIITCLGCNKDFKQTPDSHLRGAGCPTCYAKICNKHNIKTTKQFILEALEIPIHKGKYSYSKTIYKNARKCVIITCLGCNKDFKQTPDNHLVGKGCRTCGSKRTSQKLISNKEDFIRKAHKLPLAKGCFSYSKVNYIDSRTTVIISCLLCGRDFQQAPDSHLQEHGCPFCKMSQGEKIIENFLQQEKVSYKTQIRISECKRFRPLPFDFGIYDGYKLIGLIEYQGIQHYKSFEHFGGIKKLARTIESDQIKFEYCLLNNMPLLIIPYTELLNLEQIITNFVASF